MVKMTHFINWPVNKKNSPGNNSNFTICLEGSQKYFASLEKWAISGLIKKKPVILKYINNAQANFSDCNIFYITENYNLEAYLMAAYEKPFLTISDRPGNAQRGVIVNFLKKGNNVGFEINLDAAKNQGFVINPHLLKLATIVSTQDGK